MIDLPSLFQNSIKELQSQRQAEIESLAQRINLKIGQSTSALIERITPVNQQLADRIAQLQQHNLTAKANPLPAQLLSQPNLKLIELSVQGQPLLTLSDQPVKTGQTVQLLLKTASQLVLIPSKPSNNLSAQANQSAGSLSSPQQTILSQSYREALPRQAPLQQTFRLLDALQQLPALQQQLPKQLKQSLEQLRQHAHSPQKLSTVAGLKQALQQSGVQLEATLNKQAAKPSPNPQQVPANAAIKIPESALITPQTKNQATQTTTANPLSSQDAKAALLHAEQRLSQHLTQLTQLTAKNPRQPATLQLPAQTPVDTLVVLLKQFMAGAETKSAPTQDTSQRDALLQTLQQQLQTAVAKMQTQQLHTLSQQFAKPDQPQAQHWLIELPVRLNNDVSSVEVRIDEDWVRPQEEEDSKDKVRLWTVMLAFDLPERGKLFAQLKIIQDSVSANIWAEQNTTLAEAKRKLKTLRQRLDADGVNVTSIECFKGKPPMQDIRLDYALVDIKT